MARARGEGGGHAANARAPQQTADSCGAGARDSLRWLARAACGGREEQGAPDLQQRLSLCRVVSRVLLASSASALSQRATPMAYMEAGDVAPGGVPDSVREEPKDYAFADSAGAQTLRMLQKQPRTPVPDGPVYTALQREVAYLKLNGQDAEATAGGLSRYSMARGPPPCARADVGDEQSDTAGAASPQDKKMLTMEASLEDAKTSNRLLSRALSAVQQRLKQTEAEREQLRRERDYFRNLALRFPFTLSAGGLDVPAAARR